MNGKSNAFVGFDALKQAVSMVQVLDRYGLRERLHRSGDNLSGPCPIHAGHNKTQFRVSMSKNCWICFGDCNCGGSIIDFVSRMESQFGFSVHLYQIQAPESIRLELGQGCRSASLRSGGCKCAGAQVPREYDCSIQLNKPQTLLLFACFPFFGFPFHFGLLLLQFLLFSLRSDIHANLICTSPD